MTVEALLGAIYHQHGAQAARAFFSSRILPNLGTFTEREAEKLKGAIEKETEAGLAILRSMGRGTSSASVPLQSEQRKSALGDTAREDVVLEDPSKDSRGSRTATPVTSTRRRTSSNSALTLEEGSGSIRPASERQSIA